MELICPRFEGGDKLGISGCGKEKGSITVGSYVKPKTHKHAKGGGGHECLEDRESKD